MANKVIRFSKSDVQQRTETNPNEVYKDLSMIAKQASKTVNANKQSQILFSASKTTKNDNTDDTVVVYYNKVDKLVNVNAIKNSLHNIFSWTPGERILNPEFGSNLRKLLYEGITDFNQEQIIAEIRHSVSQWEPRVQIDNIVKLTDIDDKENNTVHLRIIYSIPTLTTEQFYYDYDANAPG